MKPRSLYRVGIVAAGLLLVLLSPFGTWLAALALGSFASGPDLHIEIGSTRGWLLTEPTFEQVSLARSDGSLSATAEEISVHPFANRISSTGLTVRITADEGGAESVTDEPDTVESLPVDLLPELSVTRGRLEVVQGAEPIVVVDGISIDYRQGALRILASSAAVHDGDSQLAAGKLHAYAVVAPRSVRFDSLKVDVTTGALDVSLLGSAEVQWQSGYPTAAALELAGRDTLETVEVALALHIAGDLSPAELELTLSGTGSHAGLGSVAIESHGVVGAGSVDVQSTLRVAEGAIAIRSTYDVDGDSLQLDAVTTEGLNLDALAGTAGIGSARGSLSATAHPAAGIYTANLESNIANVAALPGKPVDVNIDAALSADGVIEMNLNSQLVTLAGLGRVSFEDGSYDVDFDGAVQTSHLMGFAAAPIAIAGRAQPDSLHLQLTTPSLPTEGLTFGPLQLEATLASGQLRAALSVEEALVSATTVIDLDGGDLKVAEVTLSRLPLARLLPDLGGSVKARITGGGKLGVATSAAQGQIELRDLAYAQWTAGDVVMQLGLDDGALHIEAAGDGVTAGARLDTASLDGKLQLDRARLTRRRVDGGVDTIILSGEFTCSAPRVDSAQTYRAELQLNELVGEINGRPLRAEGQQVARYDGGQLVIEHLRLRGPYGNLKVLGRAGADSLTLAVDADSLSLRAFHDSLDGLVSARLALRGSRRQPHATASLNAEGIAISGRAIGRVAGTATLGDSLIANLFLQQRREGSDGAVAFDTTLAAGLRAARGELLASDADSAGSATVELRAHELDLGGGLSAVLSDSVSGRLGLQGTIAFPATQFTSGLSLDAFSGVVEVNALDISRGSVRAHVAADSSPSLTFDGERAVELVDFSIPIELSEKEQDEPRTAGRIDVSGGLDGDGNPDVRLHFEKMDVLIVDQFTREPLGLPEGAVSGSARISRGERSSLQIDADMLLAFEELGEVHGQLAQSASGVTAEIEWTTEVADIVTLNASLPRDPLTEAINWNESQAQLRTDGLNLFVFLERLPQLEEFDGFLSADLSAIGLGANAQIEGVVDIEDLQLSLPDIRPRLRFAAGRLVFDGARGALEGFTGMPTKGRGQVALNGFVGLDSAATLSYEIRVDVKDLPYVYDDIVEIDDIDAQILFKSSGPGSLLQGEVQIKGGLAEPPLVDLSAPPAPPRPEAVQIPFLESTELDLALTLRDLEIKNELSDIEMEGAATVYGTFYKPRFQGELLIPEGRVIALNREFVFTKGRIVLDQLVPTYSILDLTYEPLLLNPELDLEAVAKITPIDEDEEREVVMTITGPALTAAPRFTSPGLGDTDVITLLAFGSTSTANSDREFLYEAAAAAAGQLLLSRQVQRLGVDEFQIMPSGTVLGTVGEPSLRMGKFFSVPLPVWVRYEALRREPSFGELQFEYKMTSYLTINGAGHSELELYGLGIGLKKDY